MGDVLKELPTDEFPSTSDEKEMTNWLFSPTEELKKNVTTIWADINNLLYLGLLFAVFWLPPVDATLKQFIPMANSSPVLLTIIRTVIFLVLYWIFLNGKFMMR